LELDVDVDEETRVPLLYMLVIDVTLVCILPSVYVTVYPTLREPGTKLGAIVRTGA
jgi:hypothetical protein